MKKASVFNLKAQFLQLWHKILTLNATPHSIALGLGLGMFVGFLPIMGVQMFVVMIVSIPFRKANKVSAVSGVWITNPITVIPIYMFIYWIGTFFYSGQDILTYKTFKRTFSEILSIQGDSFWEAAWLQTKAFIGLGGDIFIPMFIGGIVIGTIAAVITYFFTKHFVSIYQGEKLKSSDDFPHEKEKEEIHTKHNWLENEMPAPGVMEGRHKKRD